MQRLKAPFTIIPPARELGTTATPAEVEALARQVARELALVGVNVNLAPVLDVARAPGLPPVGPRLRLRTPGRWPASPLAAIQGYLAGGVIPVAKHFPGLGDTLADSHQVLPLAQSDDPSRELDLLPFREAVAAGVPAGHDRPPGGAPSGIPGPPPCRPVALQDWLRQKLGV